MRRTDRRAGTDEMQSASAWILVKMLVEIEPCIQWKNLQLIYFSFSYFIRKIIRVSPPNSENNIDLFLLMGSVCWGSYIKNIYSLSVVLHRHYIQEVTHNNIFHGQFDGMSDCCVFLKIFNMFKCHWSRSKNELWTGVLSTLKQGLESWTE